MLTFLWNIINSIIDLSLSWLERKPNLEVIPEVIKEMPKTAEVIKETPKPVQSPKIIVREFGSFLPDEYVSTFNDNDEVCGFGEDSAEFAQEQKIIEEAPIENIGLNNYKWPDSIRKGPSLMKLLKQSNNYSKAGPALKFQEFLEKDNNKLYIYDLLKDKEMRKYLKDPFLIHSKNINFFLEQPEVKTSLIQIQVDDYYQDYKMWKVLRDKSLRQPLFINYMRQQIYQLPVNQRDQMDELLDLMMNPEAYNYIDTKEFIEEHPMGPMYNINLIKKVRDHSWNYLNRVNYLSRGEE